VDERTAAGQIVAAGRRLGSRGLISAGEGTLSIRLDDDRIAITPRGRRKDELTDGDVVVVRIADARVVGSPASDAAPSSDLAVHLAALAARRDIGAVAHAHLPAAMALSLAGEVPDPAALPETALFIPRLPYLPFGEPGSDELASRIAEALTAGPAPLPVAVLLERHGAIAVGADLATAVDRLELVEVLCRAWRDSLLIRAARDAGPTG
jgi:L-fuculose-phosphate aldolase